VTRGLVAGAVAAAALVGGWWALRPGPAPTPARTPAAEATRASPPPAAAIAAGDASARGSAPAVDDLRGLRGTTPSGGLAVGAEGHFVPGPEAVLFFEYWLAAKNELPVPELVARIRAAIRERLAPPADAEAEAFLGDYLDYLAAGDETFRAPGLAESADAERRFQWIRELRREHFGPELAERLFGAEEQAVRLHLERRRIREDGSLGPEERAARLEALEASYPEATREARARATASLRHAREEAALREAGASPAEIDALREAHFGPEAAARMRALDERRAAWQRRVSRYRSEHDARLAGLDDPAARAAALEALRAEHFSPEEARRIAILDREEAAPAGGPDAPATP
jgi:lipase chaperone LimK